MAKEMFCCRYEGENSQTYLEEHRLNIANRLNLAMREIRGEQR